jgi:hypothetical protein
MKCSNTKKSAPNMPLAALLAAAGFLTFGSACVQAQSPPSANLQLWLEGNAGVTTNGSGDVTAWTDQSPNRYVAAVPSGANPPVYLPIVAGLSNMPSVQFSDGQWLQLQSALDITGDVSGFALIDLYAGEAVDNIRPITLQGNPTSGVPEPTQWFIDNGNNGWSPPNGYVWLQRGDGSTAPVYGVDFFPYNSSGPLGQGQYIVLGFTAHQNPNANNAETVSFYLNNVSFGGMSQDINTPVGASIPMLIGGQDGASLDGGMAELLLYNTALTSSNITAVWNYLTNKYNIRYSPPAVAIASPANGATLSDLTNTTVTVSVSDPEGTVANVQLYVNGSLIATAIAPPYQFTVSASPGTMTLTAVATDTLGLQAGSAPVSVTVTGPPPSYTPGTNLQLWLEANVGVVTNGSGGVIGWNDQSGNNNNAALAAAAYSLPAANPSTLVTNTPSGQPSIHMLGANNNYLAIPNSASLEITGDIATALVVQDNATGQATFPWWQGGALPSPNGFIFLGAPPSLIRGNGSSTQEYINNGPGIASGVYYVILATQTGPNETQYVDGSFFDSAGGWTLALADGFGNSSTYIGTRADAYAFGTSDLSIAEIMIFNTGLQGTNLANVQNYLLEKYGILKAVEAPDQPPTAAITSPTNGSTITGANATVMVTAAANADGSVASVQLYMNGSLLSTATAAPYQFTATFQGSGTATLTAVATDNLGLSTTSAPVTLTIAGVTPIYTPGANLQLWLEANEGVVTNGSGGVIGWNDQSGNNNNATLGEGGNPSVLVADTPNGQPSINLVGANYEYFTIPNSASLEITGDIAGFVVAKSPAYGNYQWFWYQGGACGYPSPNAFILTPGGNPCPNRGTGCNETQDGYVASTPLPPNTYAVMGFSQSGRTMTQTFNGFANGTQLSTVTPIDGDGSSLLYIGARADFYAFGSSDLSIAEIMIFNTALEGTYLANAESYLLGKYSLGVLASAVQTSAPILSVARQSNGSILISWPQSYTGYALQSTSSLSSGSWAAVAGVVNNQISVTPTGGEQFYRLISGVQTPAPSLSVARQSNGSVLISWPESYTGYVLQSTSSLSSGSWAAVAGVVNNQISVTPTGGEQFYRLILP